MEEKKTYNSEVIDLRVIFKKIWDNRKLFYKVLPIVFVLSCIYIFSLPRYYKSEVKLAPELGSSMSGGGLSALASSFGFDLNEMQTSDAITPLLYPDLMDDNGFINNLMNIHVVSRDGDINTTYHDYLKNHQKKAWWLAPVEWIKNLLPKTDDDNNKDKGMFDPYDISRKENGLYELLRSDIGIATDKKTGVITISVKSQDAYICRELGDSIQERLQVFITQYRTNKSRIDYEYYKRLASEAKQDYEKARRIYGSMSDASTNVALRSVELKLEDLENDMQLKFNAYSTLNNQLQAAKAKVQENTPAFTVIKKAAVPVKPAGPKRMIFVASMLVLAFIGEALWLVRNDLHFRF